MAIYPRHKMMNFFVVLILMAFLAGRPYAQFPKEIEEKSELERGYSIAIPPEEFGEEEKIKEKLNPFSEALIERDYDEFVVMCYDVCSPKNPITKAMIDDAKNGTLSDDRNFKCYLTCAFKTLELFYSGNNTINENAVWTQFTDRFGGIIDRIIDKCLPISDTEDECEMTYKYINCSINIDRRAIDFIPVSTHIQIKKKKSE